LLLYNIPAETAGNPDQFLKASYVRQLPSCLPEPTRYHGSSGRGGGLPLAAF
jgi:hypothetical protein